MSAADPEPPPDPSTDPETLSALAAILALHPLTAARIRGLTPARRRPHRQTGPELDLGDADGDAHGAPGDG